MIRGMIELPTNIVDEVRNYMLSATKTLSDISFNTVINDNLNINLFIESSYPDKTIKLIIEADRGSFVETTKYTIYRFINFLNVFSFKIENELVLIELVPKGFVKNAVFYTNSRNLLKNAKTEVQLRDWINYKSFTNKAEFFEVIYALLHNQNMLLCENLGTNPIAELLKEKLAYYGYDQEYYEDNIEKLEKSLYVISDNILNKLLLYLLRVLYENKECELTKDTYDKLFKRFYKLLVIEDYIEE